MGMFKFEELNKSNIDFSCGGNDYLQTSYGQVKDININNNTAVVYVKDDGKEYILDFNYTVSGKGVYYLNNNEYISFTYIVSSKFNDKITIYSFENDKQQ